MLSFLFALALSAHAAEPAPETHPTPFTADQIRDNFPVGTVLLWEAEAGEGPQRTRWTVVEADAERVTFRFEVLGPAGKPVEAETRDSKNTWDSLRRHALYEKGNTAISEARVTVPAGSFAVRRYERSTKTEGGETMVETFDFDLEQPGPPVRVKIEVDGTRVTTLELVSRTKPAK